MRQTYLATEALTNISIASHIIKNLLRIMKMCVILNTEAKTWSHHFMSG